MHKMGRKKGDLEQKIGERFVRIIRRKLLAKEEEYRAMYNAVRFIMGTKQKKNNDIRRYRQYRLGGLVVRARASQVEILQFELDHIVVVSLNKSC